MPPQDLTGLTFGRLTTISIDLTKAKVSWLCRCECGNMVTVAATSLKSGNTKSCGCFRNERILQSVKTHGLSNSPEHGTWTDMKTRCNNENATSYKNYGGRGITVCDRWLNSFEAFYADMGPKPGAEYSIERNDPNGNYEPGNCRWATMEEQQSNRRNNRYIEYNGKRYTVAQLCRETGITEGMFYSRAEKGWDVETIVSTPAQRLYEINGELKTSTEWARIYGISVRTVNNRISKGQTIFQALRIGEDDALK